ncbi:MAG: hypothetical protein WC201_02910 [Bacilli bacterium]
MKKIDGFISDKDIDGNYLIFETYGKLGFAYSVSYMDSDPKVYLKKMPTFNEVYAYFMSCKTHFLKINKSQDICLSLFYNPYFEEFYLRLKNDIKNISNNRLKFLKKYLLSDFADPIQYRGIIEMNVEEKEYYITHDIFNKSKELLQLINLKLKK